jgi:hypothetical protein
MKKALVIMGVAALAVAAGFGIWKSVSGTTAGDRGKASIPSDASTVNNAEIIWGPIVRFSRAPLPSKRVTVSQNILILDHDLPSPFVTESKNARVSCDIYYTRGWSKVVRKETVAGAWTPPHIAEKRYGGQLTGQVSCGPFTVWKKSHNLWLGVNPRVTYEKVTFDRTKGKGIRGEIIRMQLRKGAVLRRVDPTQSEATSFLPKVAGGTIYPALGNVPLGSRVESVWQTFGRPPDKTCSGSACYWATPKDKLFLQLSTPYDSAEESARTFDRVVVSSTHPSSSKLTGWKTPEGIHLGSTSQEVRTAYPHGDCVGNRCNITPPLTSLDGARYRFQLALILDGDVANANSKVETIDVTLGSAEGICRPTISFREQGIPASDTTFAFAASCSGKLKSARLEPLDGSTVLSEADSNERFRLDPALYTDAGGPPQTGLVFRALSTQGMANGAYTWEIGCETADPADPAQCAPGRGSGEAAWNPALFEGWELVLRGRSSTPSQPQGRREVIAPLRFVAEFVDRPPFTYILREAF